MKLMNRFSFPALALTATFFAAPLLHLGCSSSDSIKDNPLQTPDAGNGNSSRGDGGSGGYPCVQDPKTSEELLNGCTDSVKVVKQPSLPLLGPNGDRPPLP